MSEEKRSYSDLCDDINRALDGLSRRDFVQIVNEVLGTDYNENTIDWEN